MVTAATICTLLALVALLHIEAWRRRTTAELETFELRRRTREQAWEAVQRLEQEAA
jgi:hypothetical protein